MLDYELKDEFENSETSQQTDKNTLFLLKTVFVICPEPSK